MINIGIKSRPDVGIMFSAQCPICLIDLELSGTNIFSFFQVFGRFWLILEIFRFFFFVAKLEKKICHKKKTIFSKTIWYLWYGHQIWTPYSSRARSNPNSHRNKFFSRKKLISENSLSLPFKGGPPRYITRFAQNSIGGNSEICSISELRGS